jgi:DNA-binding transcriptional ArsR family regulator
MANVDRQFTALGDPTRRAILKRLRRGPMPVGKLAAGFGVSRPAISQHLKVLKEADLVNDRADGNRRIYELNPDAFASLREYFDEFWGVALTAFKAHVAQANQTTAVTAKTRNQSRRSHDEDR